MNQSFIGVCVTVLLFYRSIPFYESICKINRSLNQFQSLDLSFTVVTAVKSKVSPVQFILFFDHLILVSGLVDITHRCACNIAADFSVYNSQMKGYFIVASSTEDFQLKKPFGMCTQSLTIVCLALLISRSVEKA